MKNKMVVASVLLFLPLSLSGCFVPPTALYFLFAADGASVVTSGKTVSDHALSVLLEKDCAAWKIVKDGEICVEEQTVATGDGETALAEVSAPRGPENKPALAR